MTLTLVDLLAAISWNLRDPEGFAVWFEAQPEDVQRALCDLAQHAADAGLRAVVR